MLSVGVVSRFVCVVSGLIVTLTAWGAWAGTVDNASPPATDETSPTGKDIDTPAGPTQAPDQRSEGTESPTAPAPPAAEAQDTPFEDHDANPSQAQSEQIPVSPPPIRRVTTNQIRTYEDVTPGAKAWDGPNFMVHVGPVLGLTEAAGAGGNVSYGLQGGIGWRMVELVSLVGSWGQLKFEESGNDRSPTAYPILFQLNAVVPMSSDLRLFFGPAVGLVHYREDLLGSGTGSTNAFAVGLQGAAAFRLADYLWIRAELGYLHVGDSTMTVSGVTPGYMSSDGFRSSPTIDWTLIGPIPARHFLNAFVSLCLGS